MKKMRERRDRQRAVGARLRIEVSRSYGFIPVSDLQMLMNTYKYRGGQKELHSVFLDPEKGCHIISYHRNSGTRCGIRVGQRST